MDYADLFFIYIFLPVCMIFYYLARNIKTRNLVLIIFSLLFYAWGQPLWILLLLLSAIFNWYIGLLAGRYRDTGKGKIITLLSVLANILILFIFRFIGLYTNSSISIFDFSNPTLTLTFPLGISFYTLRAISYVTDCYRGSIKPQEKLYLFMTYFSLFPILIDGPVVRYSTISDELTSRTPDAQDVYEGIVLLVKGLTKKVVFANNLGSIAGSFFGRDIYSMSCLGTWYGAIIFTLYVYFEFSGYSDMAIGMGRMFGFHFEKNFDHPYVSSGMNEFWSRWNISLGTFLRDYLLGLKIFGKYFRPLNIMLIWFCIGLWHGLSLNYIIWGLYCGLFVSIELFLGKDKLKKVPSWLKHIICKLIIIVGFGIFYFRDLNQLGRFFINISGAGVIMGQSSFADVVTWNSLLNNILLIVFAVILCTPVLNRLADYYLVSDKIKAIRRTKIAQMVCSMLLLILCTIFLADKSGSSLLSWRF